MAKSRERQRENKKLYKAEERLNAKNEFGISDPTPKKAVENIRRGKCGDGQKREDEIKAHFNKTKKCIGS